MPDDQEKSGDLIAELAKLMAVGGTEPEARPGPRPVQAAPSTAVPETTAPQRPVGLRIPGFDQPVAAEPSQVAVPTPGPAPSAGTSAPPARPVQSPAAALSTAASAAQAAPAIRIPGMDRAVPVPPPQRDPAIDFGTLPPPVMPRPQPINDWQNRETPKPAPAKQPELPTNQRDDGADDGDGTGPAAAETDVPEGVAAETAPVSAAPRSALGGLDYLNFDFNISAREVPKPVAPASVPAPEPKSAAPAAQSTGDPIADLIAAELDAGLSQPATPAPVTNVAVPSPEDTATAPSPAAPAVSAPQGQRLTEARPRTSAPIIGRPPAPRSPAPTENDRFAVSPIFGPARKGGIDASPASQQIEPLPIVPPPPVSQGAPAPKPVAADRDPMDEIESLIGEAVRVELVQAERNAAGRGAASGSGSTASEPSVEARPETRPEARVQAPVVPPLTAGLPPRRAALKDSEPRMSADEAASLSASASATAPAGRKPVKPPKPEPIAARPKPPKTGRGMRQYVGMAVAGTLLLASGLGLYWVLTMNHGTTGDAPVLQADAEPVKKDAPAQASTNNGQGSVVFNELEGKSDTSNEQLVSRDDSADTPIADVAQAEPQATNSGETELANRKVRTVTVRPDGSIVSGDEAGSEALPVDRPNVPALPNSAGDTQATDLLASVQNNADAAATTPETSATTAAPQDVSAQLAAIQPSPGNVIDPNIVAPVPLPRVTDRSQLNGTSRTAAISSDSAPLDISGRSPAASSSSAPKVVSGGSGTYVQLSSQRTQDDAAAALRRTQQRLGSVVNGGALQIRRVDLGAKGIWYRVVLPTSSFQEATQACATIKANGGECVAING